MTAQSPIFIEDVFDEAFTPKFSQLSLAQDSFIVHCVTDELTPFSTRGHLILSFSSQHENEFAGFRILLIDAKGNEQKLQTEVPALNTKDLNWAELPNYLKARILDIVSQDDVQAMLQDQVSQTFIALGKQSVH